MVATPPTRRLGLDVFVGQLLYGLHDLLGTVDVDLCSAIRTDNGIDALNWHAGVLRSRCSRRPFGCCVVGLTVVLDCWSESREMSSRLALGLPISFGDNSLFNRGMSREKWLLDMA
jgi:hypothetical protein